LQQAKSDGSDKRLLEEVAKSNRSPTGRHSSDDRRSSAYSGDRAALTTAAPKKGAASGSGRLSSECDVFTGLPQCGHAEEI